MGAHPGGPVLAGESLDVALPLQLLELLRLVALPLLPLLTSHGDGARVRNRVQFPL